MSEVVTFYYNIQLQSWNGYRISRREWKEILFR